jgi:hypothetical protein
VAVHGRWARTHGRIGPSLGARQFGQDRDLITYVPRATPA